MSKSQVQKFYDCIAEDYDSLRFSRPYFQQIDRFERDYVLGKVKPGVSVLEIGPGTGRFTARLVEKTSSVTAVDISAEMLKQLKKNVPSTRLTSHHLSIEDLTILSNFGEFDTVVCMRVLPHLENPIPALTLIGKAVKPGGNVVFDFWNLYSFIGVIRKLFRRPSHVLTKFYTYRQMMKIIETSGLIVEDKVAWGYPRIRTISLDHPGNLLIKPLGYSVIFNSIRK